MNAITLKQLQYYWPNSDTATLNIEQFCVKRAEKVFVSGPSGCGKSTFLSLLTGINVVDNRSANNCIEVLGTNLAALSNAKRDQFRADHIGYIFQQFNLIPYLSVIENVMLPCHFSAKRKSRVTTSLVADAQALLNKLHLDERYFTQSVTSLSIGQQQRVAVARALMGNPELIIADEPSSALDQHNTKLLMELLIAECSQRQSTLIFVSHDDSLLHYFDKSYRLDELNLVARTAHEIPA
jgi:putative ABC transport system ATP-binding protein